MLFVNSHPDIPLNFNCLVNCVNNFDIAKHQFQVNSTITPNGFRIEKIRLTRGKFNRPRVIELVEGSLIPGVNYLAHLSDFGNEQRILLPEYLLQLYCQLHSYLNIHTHLTDIEGGNFTFNGRRFNAALAFNRLNRDHDLGFFESLFRSGDLADFWKVFNFNIRQNKFQILLELSEQNMAEHEDFEALFYYAKLMLILQFNYIANFRQLTNHQLIDVLSSVVVRLEMFTFVDIAVRPLDRLKLTLRNVIKILRENPHLHGAIVWWISTLSVLETLHYQIDLAKLDTVEEYRRFFELISGGAYFPHFHGPFGMFNDVFCLPSVENINYNEIN